MDLTADLENLRAARQALRDSMGADLHGFVDANKPFHHFPRLIECSWTPGCYRRLADLGTHAAAVHAWIAVGPSGPPSFGAAWGTWRLILAAERAAVGSNATPFAQIEPWLSVIVGEPDTSRSVHVQNSLFFRLANGRGEAEQSATQVGRLAALVWAAGISPEEAYAQKAAGTLTEDGLRTLATLRGLHLPAPAAAKPDGCGSGAGDT